MSYKISVFFFCLCCSTFLQLPLSKFQFFCKSDCMRFYDLWVCGRGSVWVWKRTRINTHCCSFILCYCFVLFCFFPKPHASQVGSVWSSSSVLVQQTDHVSKMKIVAPCGSANCNLALFWCWSSGFDILSLSPAWIFTRTYSDLKQEIPPQLGFQRCSSFIDVVSWLSELDVSR